MIFDTLQNFAEVGIAVAGFSGIAAALDVNARKTWAHARRAGLRLLLETAGLVVFFAFVPQILDRTALSESAAWRISAAFYAVMHVAQGRAMVLRARRFGKPDPGPPAWSLALGIVVIVGQIVSVALGSTPQIQLVYVVALAWHTWVAAGTFSSMLLASVEDRDE